MPDAYLRASMTRHDFLFHTGSRRLDVYWFLLQLPDILMRE